MRKIVAYLPKDRSQPGRLSLCDAAGDAIESWPCLGKAAGELARAAGNPKRDPLKRNGDTPLGDYAPARVQPAYGAEGIGNEWIPIEGADGDALQARLNGRRGLAIHAGRGDARLVPTAGCVRMLQRDFDALCELVGDEVFEVSVRGTP